jgi:hypothetical protein
MAVTISGSPQAATPAYNKMQFVVTSNQSGQTNYRYVCDVEYAGGPTIVRLKSDKLPNGEGFFDVAKVVETIIAPQKPSLTQTAFANHYGYYQGYQLQFYDEYGSTPVVYTGSPTMTSGRLVFAGNLEQLEFLSYTGSVYFPTAIASGINNTIPALTSISNRTVYSDGYGWLSIGQSGSLYTYARISYYSSDNVSQRTFTVSISGSVASNSIIRLGVGPMNIKALTSGECNDGFAGSHLFPTAKGSYYLVHFGTAAVTYSKDNQYTIGSCQRFNSQPVHFINKYGGIDSYTFTLKNRKRANIKRETYGYNSDVYGTTTYDKVWAGEFDYIYQLNSDWLTDAESAWLIELIRSSQVWLELDGQLVEAVVNADTYQFVTRRNDKLQLLQVEIGVAYKNNIL